MLFRQRGDVRRRVDEIQRAEGYRVVGAFEDGEPSAASAAGFRTGHNLAWGHYLYVDDLSTRPEARKRGHGRGLLAWLAGEAERLGCDQLHLSHSSLRLRPSPDSSAG